MRMPNTTAAAEQVAVVVGTDLVAVLAFLPGSGVFPGTAKGQEPGQDQLGAQALVAPTSARAGEVGLMDAPAQAMRTLVRRRITLEERWFTAARPSRLMGGVRSFLVLTEHPLPDRHGHVEDQAQAFHVTGSDVRQAQAPPFDVR